MVCHPTQPAQLHHSQHTGTMIASASEDGVISLWSKSLATQRSVVVQDDHAILQLSWDRSSTALAAVAGSALLLCTLQGSSCTRLAAAHDALALAVDWGASTDRVLTGGEDCRYRLWSREGQRLFSSQPLHAPVTCVAWAPSRDAFAVGVQDTVMLCSVHGPPLCKVCGLTGPMCHTGMLHVLDTQRIHVL